MGTPKTFDPLSSAVRFTGNILTQEMLANDRYMTRMDEILSEIFSLQTQLVRILFRFGDISDAAKKALWGKVDEKMLKWDELYSDWTAYRSYMREILEALRARKSVEFSEVPSFELPHIAIEDFVIEDIERYLCQKPKKVLKMLQGISLPRRKLKSLSIGQ